MEVNIPLILCVLHRLLEYSRVLSVLYYDPVLMWPFGNNSGSFEAKYGAGNGVVGCGAAYGPGHPSLSYQSIEFNGTSSSFVDLVIPGTVNFEHLSIAFYFYPLNPYSGTLFHYKYIGSSTTAVTEIKASISAGYLLTLTVTGNDGATDYGSSMFKTLFFSEMWYGFSFVRDPTDGRLLVYIGSNTSYLDNNSSPDGVFVAKPAMLRIGGDLDGTDMFCGRITCVNLFDFQYTSPDFTKPLQGCAEDWNWNFQPSASEIEDMICLETTTESLHTTSEIMQTTENLQTTIESLQTTENLQTTTESLQTTENLQTTTESLQTTENLQTTKESLQTTENLQTTTESVQTTENLQITTESLQTTENLQTTTKSLQTTSESLQTTTESVVTTTSMCYPTDEMGYFKLVEKNKAPLGSYFPLAMTNISNGRRCAAACLKLQICISFSINKSVGSCQLFSELFGSGDLQVSTGDRYYKKLAIPC